MEKDIVIKISTDSSDSVDALEKLKKSFVQLDEQAAETGEQMNTMNKKMEQLKGLALQMGTTSPIGKKAIEEAAKLRGELDKIEELVRRNNTDFDRFREVVGVGQVAINSYAAFQSVMAITGVESEKLLETMVKLQAAQQLLNSLEAARSSLLQKNAILTKGLEAVQRAYGVAVGTSTGVMKAFRLALISTGIGALVVLIGTLVANWKEFTQWVEKTINRFHFLQKAVEPLIWAFDKVKEGLEALGLIDDEVTEKAKANAQSRIANAEKEEEAINSKYDNEIAKAQAAGEKTLELEQAKRNALLLRIKDEAKAIIELAKLNGEFTEEQKERAKELVDEFKRLKNEQVISEIKEEKRLTDEFKKQQEERLAAAEKTKQEETRLQQEQLNREEEQWQLLQDIQLNAKDYELLLLQQKYDEKFALAEGNAELEKELLRKQKEDIAAIEQEFAEKELESKWEQAQKLRDLRLEMKALNQGELSEDASPEEVKAFYETRRELENEEFEAKMEDLRMRKEVEGLTEEEYLLKKGLVEKEHEDNITQNKKDNAKAQLEIEEKKKAATIQTLAKTANVLNQFSQIAGEETAAGKTLAIASSTINTYRGVSDALAATTVTPFETGLKFANAAAIGIAGIQNVRKIMQVSVPSANGGGGGNISLPNMTPPQSTEQSQQFDNPDGTFTDDLINKPDKPQKVVLLESDIALARSNNEQSITISEL